MKIKKKSKTYNLQCPFGMWSLSGSMRYWQVTLSITG